MLSSTNQQRPKKLTIHEFTTTLKKHSFQSHPLEIVDIVQSATGRL